MTRAAAATATNFTACSPSDPFNTYKPAAAASSDWHQARQGAHWTLALQASNPCRTPTLALISISMPTCCAAAPLCRTTATTDPDKTIVVYTHHAASADSDPDVQLLPQQQDIMLGPTSLATTSTKRKMSKVTGRYRSSLADAAAGDTHHSCFSDCKVTHNST